jgi:hypothetical protein
MKQHQHSDSITEEEITKTTRSISSKKKSNNGINSAPSSIMHADKIFVLNKEK